MVNLSVQNQELYTQLDNITTQLAILQNTIQQLTASNKNNNNRNSNNRRNFNNNCNYNNRYQNV